MNDNMIGQRITVWCLNYIYAGVLAAHDKRWAILTDASLVYETGPLDAHGYADAQKIPHPVWINLRCVESVTLEH